MSALNQGSSPAERVYASVRRIPYGEVASYGQVGKSAAPPVDARTVGRIMACCPEGLPWWRVVASDGHLAIAKRGPELAALQRAHLRDEGVTFDEREAVRMETHRTAAI
jgi:methylated-DNA-protein-cysteine methyltransferase-like protein